MFADKKKYYEGVIRRAQRSLEKAPKEGHLRVTKNKGTFQYFLCTQTGDSKGIYIRKKDRELSRGLAQRDEDRKVLTCAEAWIRWIDHAAASMPEEDLKSVFAKSENRWSYWRRTDTGREEILSSPWKAAEDRWIPGCFGNSSSAH